MAAEATAPGAPRPAAGRLGPRPLAHHLAVAATTWLRAPPRLSPLRGGPPPPRAGPPARGRGFPPARAGPRRRGRSRVCVLVVPSLINRAYILDLAAEHSLMRYLAARGLDAALVAWGAPGPVERGFALTDYIAGRLGSALAAARAGAGGG